MERRNPYSVHLVSQVYSPVLCSFLEAGDWGNTLQFDFLLQHVRRAQRWVRAAGARLVWEALALFAGTSPISRTHTSQSHSLPKAPSESPFQSVVEQESSALGCCLLWGLFNYHFLASSLPVNDDRGSNFHRRRKFIPVASREVTEPEVLGALPNCTVRTYPFCRANHLTSLPVCPHLSNEEGRADPVLISNVEGFQSISQSLNKRRYRRTTCCSCHAAVKHITRGKIRNQGKA